MTKDDNDEGVCLSGMVLFRIEAWDDMQLLVLLGLTVRRRNLFTIRGHFGFMINQRYLPYSVTPQDHHHEKTKVGIHPPPFSFPLPK